MTNADNAQESQWRRELEAAGERAVRDNINSRGSLVTGGEPKQQFIRKWLREKDVQRSEKEIEQVTREKQGFDYTRWTFYVAVGALIAATIGIIVTVLHV
jgi:hypothetical protein